MKPYYLNIAEGFVYNIIPCDEEAAVFTGKLARIMEFDHDGPAGKEIHIFVKEHKRGERVVTICEAPNEPILCMINPAESIDMFNIQVEKIARAIVHDLVGRGGVLIHGGLCSLDRSGAIMAGPGTVGKSTASARLPEPWISYSDDATLVVPSGNGGFTAHPWPTWSRFYSNGPCGTWNVAKGVPLRALFFLKQDPDDFIVPVDVPHAGSMLIDTIEHVTRSGRMGYDEKKVFIKQYAENARRIVSAVPAYRLCLSLTGEFWKEMEKVMPKNGPGTAPAEKPVKLPDALSKDKSDEIHFIYRGVSMNPTFVEPEMMTVVPYAGAAIKKGDVVCFRTEKSKDTIVHRVIRVDGAKILTRGDNNATPDPYTLMREDIIGRVISSCRKDKVRRIYGAKAGVMVMYLERTMRRANRIISGMLHGVYRGLSKTGVFRKMLPKGSQIDLVVFERNSSKYPKLVFSGRTIGMYDNAIKEWWIRRPYRLFVDENRLPKFQPVSRFRKCIADETRAPDDAGN